MKREPDFSKCGGLLPAIVQDARTGLVLMLGYMNQEAYSQTREKGVVTFFSRSRNRLWTKGESSGNFLALKEIVCDCDCDAILVLATPSGPTCHAGTTSCFEEIDSSSRAILGTLRETIAGRRTAKSKSSYTAELFEAGIDAIAQKVGEEAIEVVIEAKNDNRERLLNESADLLYHLMVLWESRNVSLDDVCGVLERRGRSKSSEGE
jgi:phosphoribosyl-ATP pyrophosphohydrolase/phosphoribosyl-AMP cyclohydrolase